jgi:hypothetical protein
LAPYSIALISSKPVSPCSLAISRSEPGSQVEALRVAVAGADHLRLAAVAAVDVAVEA